MDISTFLLLFLLQTPLTSSKALDILKGSSLSVGKPSDKLVSAGGEFSAGFFPVGDNAFCFSIWLTISSVPTVVWMANRDDPVERSSAISLSKDGKLILRNSVGTIIWTTKSAALTTSQTSQLQLRLLNTGNLVLHYNSDNGIIWQSFDSPTDTLLPRQTLTWFSSLVSKSRQGDYSSGYYKLSFDNDNVLRLLFQDPTISSLYWPDPFFTDPAEAGRSRYNNSRDAVLEASGYFWSSDKFEFRATDFPLVLHRRLTLDTDGNLRLYSLQKMNETRDWVVTWQAFSDPCRIHGICGPNSLCSYNHASGRSCYCLRGFMMKDPTDWSYGCIPEFNLSCNQSDESSFVQLAHVEFYGFDSDFLPNVTLQTCQKECLKRCNCKGVQFKFSTDQDGAGAYNCYPKFLLANGRRSPGFEGDLYLRLPKAGLVYNKTTDKEQRLECNLHKPVTQPRKINQTEKLLLWFATILGGVEVTCIFLVFVFLSRTSKNSDPAAQAYLLTTRFKRFTFSELKRATQGFRELIGQGAGGAVYKGVLPDQRVAAIKRLNDATQGEAEFLAEVNTVGRLNHMNLIEIWGYCAEGKHRLLVYESMELGSLAESLSSSTLDWEKRFEIAVGTAKGLAYLHEECLEWVLHCDVKPQNILLDSNYQPKIADFGLSKLRDRGEVDGSNFSKMRGTRGYMAPEWVYNLPITSKVDVYSYGVVVLEMVTGNSPSGMHSSESRGAREYRRLVTLLGVEIMNKKAASRESLIEEIVEPSMAGKYDMATMELLVKVALQCVAEGKDDRPTMKQVVEMLLSHKMFLNCSRLLKIRRCNPSGSLRSSSSVSRINFDLENYGLDIFLGILNPCSIRPCNLHFNLGLLLRTMAQEVEAITLAQEKPRESQASPTELIRTLWRPPRPDYVKVNVDAAMDTKKEKMGISVVVRDFRGEVNVVVATPKQIVKNASAAESLAMLRAVLLCSELGLRQVQLEGDAKMVVEAINSNSYNSSWNGQVIEDIKSMVHTQPRWSVSFTGRGGNKAAHALRN